MTLRKIPYKIIIRSKHGYEASTDRATAFIITLEVRTGVRRDNPMWHSAIHEAIRAGRYEITDIDPAED